LGDQDHGFGGACATEIGHRLEMVTDGWSFWLAVEQAMVIRGQLDTTNTSGFAVGHTGDRG